MSKSPVPVRCRWANPADALYVRYHDEEWGVPCADEVRLFEMLNLEGAQAGLSWSTVLAKRENYRKAFDQWDHEKVARYGERDLRRLLADAGIIRNRLKIGSAIANARAMPALIDDTADSSPTSGAGSVASPSCRSARTAPPRRRAPTSRPRSRRT